MSVHHTGDSGAYLELKGKGGSQKGKKWEQETSELGMGEGLYNNCSSSDSGLVFTPQPFPSPPPPPPPSHSHSVRGSWGLWFLFCLGTRSRREEGVGKSSGFSFQGH